MQSDLMLLNRSSESDYYRALAIHPESGQCRRMGLRARWVATKEILWGHPWVRVLLVVWALVCGYDQLSGFVSQVSGWDLPTLAQILRIGVVNGSVLLPWWGWLLVLQGVIFLSIFEFVVRHVRATAPVPTPQAAPAPTTRLGRQIQEEDTQAASRQWLKVGSFELWQAACLWVNEQPPVNSLVPASDAARACLARLTAAIHDGELVRVPPTGFEALSNLGGKPLITEHTRVTREALVNYAKAEKEKPPFLFPLKKAVELTWRLADPQFAPPAVVPPARSTESKGIPAHAYPKAALVIEVHKPTISATSGRQPEYIECSATIKNTTLAYLDGVVVYVTEILKDGEPLGVSGPLLLGAKGAYGLQELQTMRFRMIYRDLKDVVSKPPFILRMEDGEFPLQENAEYVLLLELRSAYPTPTLVTVEVITGERGKLNVKLRDQSV